MPKAKFYLIDATAFCYRAFYALGNLSTSAGQPTGAIYGFTIMLNKILKDKKPDFLAVCFDISRDTKRRQKFSDYKMQRPPMPEGLSGQIPLIKEVIRAYGIALVEREGYEADDIIATLAKKAGGKGLDTVIVSSDKDILQLVSKDTVVFSPYEDKGAIYGHKEVLERFGVLPHQVPDIIALMGDAVDNIPGVKGIGEKTAVSLIKSFGSVEKLLSKADTIEQEKLKEAIKDNRERIKLNKELAVLDKGMDIDFNLDDLKISEPNAQELFRLFKAFEFKTLLKDLPLQEEALQELSIETLKDEELDNIPSPFNEMVLCGQDSRNFAFFAKDKLFRLDKFGPRIEAILSNPHIKKIGHDLKKIKLFLAKDNFTLEGLAFDVMLAGYLLDPAKSQYSLADLAWDYLGKAPSNKFMDNYRSVELILELRAKLENELKEKSLLSLFNDVEMPLVEVLAEMELNGIKLDTAALADLSKDLEKRLIKLIDDIYEISGVQFNINSPKQLREILFEKLKLPVGKKSKTGPSTDEEVLRNLSGKHKLPLLLLEYRQLTKLKSTYIDALPLLIDRKTGRLHTCFNQAATETGRLSSSNPNLQNIPIKTGIGRLIRRAIIAARKNSILLSCDYSQIELRILAHICRDQNLTSAFKADRDIHKATAALIYGIDEKDVDDTMRETAKRVNFGIIYGLTSYGLARDLNISLEAAEGFIDAYFLRYPKVKDYIEAQIKKAKDNGFVTTILGRRRYLPYINNKNQALRQFAERQAVNTSLQGSASDLIKLAMIEIHRKIKEKRLATMMIIQIHDELLFEIPRDELAEVTAFVKDRMENVLKLSVPIKVDMKKGKNWLEMEDI